MTGLTAQLGDFAAGMTGISLPEGARQIVISGVADCIGVMIAGRAEPVVRIVQSVAGDDGDEAWVCSREGRATAAAAALINGTAAHALDYDDVALGAHPSAVLVPAILAEAEATGASGDGIIRAYLAGYEIWGELTDRDEDRHHEKGWHPTAVFGPLAAAAGCSVLRGHDAVTAARAIAIAASLTGGIVANFGTMTKPMHAGRAAQSGVLAARLAEAGMTAADNAIEHDTGFLSAISPNGRTRRGGGGSLGSRWHILESGLNIKRYPLCYATHRSIDGAIDIAEKHDVDPSAIERIDVTMSATQATILRNSRPQTGLDAKFSIQFAMAAAAISRAAGLAELQDEYVRRPEVQALMEKVFVDTTDEIDPADPIFSLNERVKFRLCDGRILDSGNIRFALGHAKNPIQIEGLRAKFDDCFDHAGVAESAGKIFTALEALPGLNAVPENLFEGIPAPAGNAPPRIPDN